MKLTAMVLGFLFSGFAIADEYPNRFFTGNELVVVCHTDVSRCAGYLAGAYDVWENNRFWDAYQRGEEIDNCLPLDADTNQLMKLFLKYGDENPEKLHHPAWVLLTGSLRENFCPPD